MASDRSWDPMAVQTMQASLLSIKSSTKDRTFFPSQAFARGGIGNLVSTGSARAGISRLPQRSKPPPAMAHSLGLSASSSSFELSASGNMRSSSSRAAEAGRPSTAGTGLSSSSRQWQQPRSISSRQFCAALSDGDEAALAAAAAASVVLGADVAGVPSVAKRDWELGVDHPYAFVSTTRPTRVCDVRPGSKWATLSLYEANPREVKRHLDITGALDQVQAEGIQMDEDAIRVRHFTWASQQREVFRRQRQEVAVRYAKSGVPQRKAYSAVAAHRGTLTEQPTGSCYLTPPDLSTSYSSRLASPQWESSTGREMSSAVSGRSMQEPCQSMPVISLPKPTYTNVYRRMASEPDELLETAVESMRRRGEQIAQRKAAAEMKHQVSTLDTFEQQLKGMQRRQVRGRTSAADQEQANQEQRND